VIDIVPGALGGELEAYDLMGVTFEGNNRLRRGFLAPEDMVEKGIYPLRKDSGV
jgi:NADH:ubiquinone oxidoreductase subunit C